MDWKRAKAILIIMFLVVNTFLFYQLISDNKNQYKYITEEELAKVTSYLEAKNIRLETEIPTNVSVIPSLRVKYNAFETEEIIKTFFQGKDYKLTEFNGGYAVSSGDVTVEVKDGIYLTYKNKGIKLQQGETNKERCLSQAERFINDLKLNTGSKYVMQESLEDGYLHLVWGQQYKDIPVENSQIEIWASEEGVAEAKLHWLEWIRADQRHSITTPIIAILEAYGDREEIGTSIRIKRIRQGYYFNTDILKKDEEGNVPLEGTILPMWVIESDKSVIYINAYSEKFERVR